MAGTANTRGAEIIDGRAMAAASRKETGEKVDELAKRLGRRPCLAVVIVGGRKDSESYVSHKVKACEEVGIDSRTVKLPEAATEREVVADVRALCSDESVDGVLVQLPLPSHVAEFAVLDAIPYNKDVDGFHPMNLGLLAARGRQPLVKPCTPAAVMEILCRKNVAVSGATATVIGRSNIVGTPVALLLLQAHATVQIVHSRTEPDALRRSVECADIVVACAGCAGLIKGEWIKAGAVVIDVGINAVPDASKKAGHRLVGDVEFAAAATRASKITPVPGGVGPMTVAMLLENTLALAEFRLSPNPDPLHPREAPP